VLRSHNVRACRSGDNLFGLLGYFVEAAQRPSGAICGRKTQTSWMEVVAERGVRSAAADGRCFAVKHWELQHYFRFLDAIDLVP
jgi:hypothetical protein